ncbi:hypothetical protein AB0N07_24965 [Streptomyces sp. NPDC051172]|uniref:hypothetical protein n=1 Tax=Streptomyces sp. NPDC051172 TaxID=3155796 RepID=UPI00341A4612
MLFHSDWPSARSSRATATSTTSCPTLLHFQRLGLRTAIVIALGAHLIVPGRLPVAIRGTSERTADSAATWAYAYRRWITPAAYEAS